MRVKDIRDRAQLLGIPKTARMKKAELIKAIQLKEGNTDCFGSGPEMDCGETDCLWREDCFDGDKK